jgi:hypothetical protein
MVVSVVSVAATATCNVAFDSGGCTGAASLAAVTLVSTSSAVDAPVAEPPMVAPDWPAGVCISSGRGGGRSGVGRVTVEAPPAVVSVVSGVKPIVMRFLFASASKSSTALVATVEGV